MHRSTFDDTCYQGLGMYLHKMCPCCLLQVHPELLRRAPLGLVHSAMSLTAWANSLQMRQQHQSHVMPMVPAGGSCGRYVHSSAHSTLIHMLQGNTVFILRYIVNSDWCIVAAFIRCEIDPVQCISAVYPCTSFDGCTICEQCNRVNKL